MVQKNVSVFKRLIYNFYNKTISKMLLYYYSLIVIIRSISYKSNKINIIVTLFINYRIQANQNQNNKNNSQQKLPKNYLQLKQAIINQSTNHSSNKQQKLSKNKQRKEHMILNSQTISNQSQSFSDYRYQKALKQISKLINVNRQIKIQSQRCRTEYEQLAQKNSQLLEINSSLQEQNTMLRNQLQQLNTTYTQLQEFCKRAEHQQKQLIKSNQIESQQKLQTEQRHEVQIEQMEERHKQKVEELQKEINTKNSIIAQLNHKLQYLNQLQAENDKLHQRYEVALKENDQLHKKCTQLNDQLIHTSTQIHHQPNEELKNKLKINQQWIKSLTEENYNLKQKVFEQEYKKERQKCSQTILKNVKDTNAFINLSSTNMNTTNDVLIKEYLKQVQKKLKKIQQEKQKLQSKYNKLKTKNHQLEAKNNTMQKDANLLTIKLSGYEQLAERQQREIQQMIQQYHKEMDRVIASNKKRPRSERVKHEQNINALNVPSQSQRQLKSLVQQMQKQIIINKTQSQQKDKLIQYLQTKVFSLQTQRAELQRVNGEIELELQQSQNLNELNNTPKNNNTDNEQSLLKTHSFNKNGGKVFMINGKKYETQLLKSKNSDENKGKNKSNHINSLENIVIQEVNQGKKVAFPPGELSYTMSHRNYSTQGAITSSPRV